MLSLQSIAVFFDSTSQDSWDPMGTACSRALAWPQTSWLSKRKLYNLLWSAVLYDFCLDSHGLVLSSEICFALNPSEEQLTLKKEGVALLQGPGRWVVQISYLYSFFFLLFIFGQNFWTDFAHAKGKDNFLSRKEIWVVNNICFWLPNIHAWSKCKQKIWKREKWNIGKIKIPWNHMVPLSILLFGSFYICVFLHTHMHILMTCILFHKRKYYVFFLLCFAL